MTLEKERMRWMQSMQAVQEELEKERSNSSVYRDSTPQRASLFTDTTDTGKGHHP